MKPRRVSAAALQQCSFTHTLDEDARALLLPHLTLATFSSGEVVVREGEADHELYLLLEGAAEVLRGDLVVQRLEPGAGFGGLGLLTRRLRAATVRAVSSVSLARLDDAGWQTLKTDHPAVALAVAEAIAGQTRDDLLHVTHVASLMHGRRLPRAPEVRVRLLEGERLVATGTPARDLLPSTVEGALTVAALMNNKPVSLTTPVLTDTALTPLPLSHWEGRQVYARSVALLLLEAAWRLDPTLELHLGPSRGTEQLIDVRGVDVSRYGDLARELSTLMESLVSSALPIRIEHWLVDEARAHFVSKGWDNAARLLKTARSANTPLATCGEVYALAVGPLVPDTSMLAGAMVQAHDTELVLDLGAQEPRRRNGHRLALADPEMIQRHRRWTNALGISSVGAFNERCVDGEVTQLIRVAEGFHEKQISQLADVIAARRDQLRVISIAGPSSSGKTTFIKRLSVQLHINGLKPVALSLDDYYVDRAKTPMDAKGEWNFEALEALNLPLLQNHVGRLLAGETVKLARFDFKSGLSHADGGQTLTLKEGDLLLLEGIHGLNPALLGDLPRAEQHFRVFIHPATSLAFDRLSRVSTTDLRLLRRIVRDRHTRGYSAAENIARWPSVQAGEQAHIFPFQFLADATFDSALVYEPAVLKVFAERYLLEVPSSHPSYATAWRLRHLVDRFVAIYPDHVPPTSIIREFIGGSGFEY